MKANTHGRLHKKSFSMDRYEYNASYSDEEALQKAIALSRIEQQRNEQRNEELNPISRNAPSHLRCPLTKCLFRDPVQVIHGNTYERNAILQWFSISKTEPVSGDKLFVTVLFENEDILVECRRYMKVEHDCRRFQKVRKSRKRTTST